MQNTLPLISVIMPVYNTEKYVGEAIESILKQTYTNFEFLIFDDASTDKSVEIINSFDDKRIHLITKPQNTGYTSSLNMGLKMAKGKYIARMDSDDISELNRFETQISFLFKNHDFIGCSANMQYINEFGDLGRTRWSINKQVYLPWELLWDNPICHPSVMIKSEVLKKLVYNLEAHPAEDYEMWTRISNYGKLYRIPEVLIYYRELEKSEFHRNQQKAFNHSIIFNQSYVKKLNLDIPFFHQEMTNFWLYLGNKKKSKHSLKATIIWLKKIKKALITKHNNSPLEIKLINIGIYNKILEHLFAFNKINKVISILKMPFLGINILKFLKFYYVKK